MPKLHKHRTLGTFVWPVSHVWWNLSVPQEVVTNCSHFIFTVTTKSLWASWPQLVLNKLVLFGACTAPCWWVIWTRRLSWFHPGWFQQQPGWIRSSGRLVCPWENTSSLGNCWACQHSQILLLKTSRLVFLVISLYFAAVGLSFIGVLFRSVWAWICSWNELSRKPLWHNKARYSSPFNFLTAIVFFKWVSPHNSPIRHGWLKSSLTVTVQVYQVDNSHFSLSI